MNLLLRLTSAPLADVIVASAPTARGAESGEVSLFKLQYESNKPKVNPSFDKSHGGYLGGGTGELQGKCLG